MSRAVRLAMIVCALLLGALAAGWVMAAHRERFFHGLRVLILDNWGLVALLDRCVGVLFVGTWILCVERKKTIAVLWLIPLALLGNVATLAYVMLRARTAHQLADIFLPIPYQPADEAVKSPAHTDVGTASGVMPAGGATEVGEGAAAWGGIQFPEEAAVGEPAGAPDRLEIDGNPEPAEA